jgi:hypothetical protein
MLKRLTKSEKIQLLIDLVVLTTVLCWCQWFFLNSGPDILYWIVASALYCGLHFAAIQLNYVLTVHLKTNPPSVNDSPPER